MGHEEKIELARARTIHKAPYYSSVVHGFVWHAVEEIPTMFCTEKLVLGYNPVWAEIASVEELAADIAHECNHFLRQHFLRGAHADDKDLFNKAADLAINPDLRNAGWKLCSEGPYAAIFPADFELPEGKTTEEYYDLLRQQKQAGGGGKKEPGAGGVGAGCCGGIGGSPQASNLESALNKSDLGRTEMEIKVIEKRAASDIKAHFEGPGRGNVPGHLLELIKLLQQESYVRWEDELGQVLRDTTGRIQSGGHDFSYARPSKRSYMRGSIRPGMVEYLPEIGVVLDTSGSMGLPQLLLAAREGCAVMQALGIDEVWFCEADAAISMNWQRVGMQFFQEMTIKGRGGTDFRPAIESAALLQPPIDLCLYLTDGDGTAPDSPPYNMEVVWGIVPGHFNKAPAKWGHPVFISDDPKVRNRPTVQP